MINFLFGWINRPIMYRTSLDEIISSIEFVILIVIIIIICTVISIIKDKWKGKHK